MALVKCTECGKEISDKAEICPNCGYKNNSFENNSQLQNKKKQKKKYVIVVICIMMLIAIIMVIIYFSTKDIREIANDNMPPQFENVKNEISIMVGETIDFNEWIETNNIKSTDNVTENIKIEIDDTSVDFSIPGIYTVTLTAADEAGNTANKDIKLIVNDYPTHKAYEDAVNLTIDQLDQNSTGGYEFNTIHISQDEVRNLEDGSIYRSIAQQLEGFYVLGDEYYSGWGNNIVPLVSGHEKEDSWLEMRTYIDDVSLFISRKNSLGEIMTRIQSINGIIGDFDYVNGTFSFIIPNLTNAAQELNITEEMLGYILAMLREYGADITFEINSCSCNLKFVGKRGIDASDFIAYENWDTQVNQLEQIVGQGYRYYYYFDPNIDSSEEVYGLFTNRGVQLGQSMNAVIFSHACGEVKTFNKENDIIYNTLNQNGDDTSRYLDECIQYIAYTIDGVGNIVYYFNASNKLMFIVYTNVVIY